MPAPKKKPDKKVHVSGDGRAAAVQAGSTDRDVAAALTGEDTLPAKGMELGRAPSKPAFDPYAERDAIADGIEDDAIVESMALVSTMVFAGEEAMNDSGSFERRVRDIIAYAEGKGLFLVTATAGDFDYDLFDTVVELNNG